MGWCRVSTRRALYPIQVNMKGWVSLKRWLTTGYGRGTGFGKIRKYKKKQKYKNTKKYFDWYFAFILRFKLYLYSRFWCAYYVALIFYCRSIYYFLLLLTTEARPFIAQNLVFYAYLIKNINILNMNILNMNCCTFWTTAHFKHELLHN